MATDSEIIQLYKSFNDKMKSNEAVILLYRLAEKEGMENAISSFEKELTSDAILENSMKTFGWGRKDKRSVITMRAILKEAFYVAKEKAKNKK